MKELQASFVKAIEEHHKIIAIFASPGAVNADGCIKYKKILDRGWDGFIVRSR